MPDFRDVDLNIARGRIVLSLMAMLSVYVDPTTAGGLFRLSPYALGVLLSHLAYSVVVYFSLRGTNSREYINAISVALDLAFASAIAFLTEGQTSPSYIFFVFAIIAEGTRGDFRTNLLVTLCSVALYLLGVAISEGVTNSYLMRAVYLAIAGYLIGFFGEQRTVTEARTRELESKAERHLIARSLHDGYVQALAATNLRLEACRALLTRGNPEETLAQLTDLQRGVAREYDEVRTYVRTLAGIEARSELPAASFSDPRLEIHANFSGRSNVGEQILQIALEGVRNAQRHARASAVAITIFDDKGSVNITIDDDGVGFQDTQKPPWAIASRVAELGGHLNVCGNESGRLEIQMPKS